MQCDSVFAKEPKVEAVVQYVLYFFCIFPLWPFVLFQLLSVSKLLVFCVWLSGRICVYFALAVLTGTVGKFISTWIWLFFFQNLHP